MRAVTSKPFTPLAIHLIFVTSVQWCGAALGRVTILFDATRNAGLGSHPIKRTKHGDGRWQRARTECAAVDSGWLFAGHEPTDIATINDWLRMQVLSVIY